MLCLRKVMVAKKFLDKREVELSRFSVENILSHSAEKSRRHPFRVSLIPGIETFYAKRGLCHNFSSKFLYRSTESLCRGTRLGCVSEKFW